MSILRDMKVHAVVIILMLALHMGHQGCLKIDAETMSPMGPTDLAGTVVSATRIDLTWIDRSNNEQGFTIQRRVGTGSFSDIATVGSDTIGYKDISLTRNTTYTYRIFAFNEAGASPFTNELTLTTWGDLLMTTTSVTDVTNISAKSGGNISFDGGSPVKERGVVWNTSSKPDISLSTKTVDGSGAGDYSSTLGGLIRNTTYYTRAYATNSEGTFYGDEVIFKTWSDIELTTMPITGINSHEALTGGIITSDGGSPVTARGVVWSTMPNPTISLITKTSNGKGIGTFYSNVIGLVPNTMYFIRAYATNSEGTFYGNELPFKTWVDVELTTSEITDITNTTALAGGNITSDGGSLVTARGVVWSTSPNPTVLLPTKTSNGIGIGPFSSTLVGLAPSTTYYVRSYAINSTGIHYGSEVMFKTL